MPVSLSCPTCAKRIRVPEELLGKPVKCPGCLASLITPAPDAIPIVKQYDSENEPPLIAKPSKRKRQEDTDYNNDDDDDKRKKKNTKYCHECGDAIRVKAEICPGCGVRQPGMDDDDEDERYVRRRKANRRDGIKTPILISAISNAVVGMIWAYTCFGIVFTIPMIILCICEILFYLSGNSAEKQKQLASVRLSLASS